LRFGTAILRPVSSGGGKGRGGRGLVDSRRNRLNGGRKRKKSAKSSPDSARRSLKNRKKGREEGESQLHSTRREENLAGCPLHIKKKGSPPRVNYEAHEKERKKGEKGSRRQCDPVRVEKRSSPFSPKKRGGSSASI